MSIKDLFDEGHSLKFVKNKNEDELREDLESTRFINAYSQKRNRFVPGTDFATASNFARFGLAEEYYDASIKRIYQTYPYDGSRAEKIEWENNSTYLDLFLFENEYPRTNGFIIFNSSSQTYTTNATSSIYSSSSPQYVIFYGGPHADSGGDYKSDFSAGPSKTGVSKANIYHTASQRTSNLEFDLEKGVTVEFWMKKDGWVSTSTAKHEFMFHNHSTGSEGDSYGSMEVYSYGTSGNSSSVFFQIQSGSTKLLFTHDTGLTNIADATWHHYALTAKTTGSTTVGNLYVDGTHKSFLEKTDTINAVTGTLVAALGALAGHVTASHTLATKTFANAGWGNVASSSFDEFRYWKTERDGQQVGRFYRDQVDGGTNTDNVKYDHVTNKVDLGVYFKFNEGITGNTSTDASVLDYSGRISNGTFVNYNSSESRNTGSAIINAGAASKEFKDPIIYSAHPSVATYATNKQLSGSVHDHENVASLYKSLPTWILEQDEKKSNHLKYLTQIIASYFDDLYMQIENLSKLKDIKYPNDTEYEKPLPFADRLLSSRNFDTPELFADAHALAKFLERGEKQLFEKKLYEVKNTIYQNIYNNLSYIQKSKGTFKSLRNFLRCFGVDEELIKLNIYATDDVYEFKENYTNTSVRKKYIDFDDLETKQTATSHSTNAYTANAYQYYDVNDSNSLSYIPAVTETLVTGSTMTIETEVIFPKRSIIGDKNYKIFPGVTSSIFGLHMVGASNTDLTFASSDTLNFNVVAIKEDNDLRNVKFALQTAGSTIFSSGVEGSSTYKNVYDNEKWNLAFRLRPTKMPTNGPALIDSLDGYYNPAASAYTYELYGVNYLSNILQNEFTISGTMSISDAVSFFANPKRIFIGAKRENFTGSLQIYSDVKVSSTRVWLDYLSNEAIKGHAKDPNSYGPEHPYKSADDSFGSNFVPEIKTLILNWTMDNITGSDSSGRFLVEDFASGSLLENHKFGDSWAKPLSAYNYSGRGDFFTTTAGFLDQAVDVEFVPSAKQKLPEVVNSDDMVKILNKRDDVVFTRDTTYVQHILSIEKSMYQTISEEMLRFFASVVDFNNLVGEPVNRYRPHYKKLEKLRELFFLNVENDASDLEKFIEYFKWIDDAVSIMISQLIPVSSNTVGLLRNMVESHLLERNKYWTKFPTLETKQRDPESSLKAIEELKYNWKLGHAPVGAEQNTNQNINCLWWKQRADRDGVLSSGVSKIDEHKSTLLKIAITEVTGTEPTLKTGAGVKYSGGYYNNRSLGRPVDLTAHMSLKLKAGSNPKNANTHDFYKSVIKWGSNDDFIYLDVDNEIKDTVCIDEDLYLVRSSSAPGVTYDKVDKKVFKMKALTMEATATDESDAYGFGGGNDVRYTDAKSTLLLPFNTYTSSVNSGYQGVYANQFGIDFTNMHEDKYGLHAEIPLQGPFAERHVGGMQHRHVTLNKGTDTQLTRPEGWHLEKFLNLDSAQYMVYEKFTNATSTGSTDVTILDMPFILTSLSTLDEQMPTDEPSPYEYWRNGVSADNPWTFLSGSTPTMGTGPDEAVFDGGYAYCEVLPERVGQTFSLVTPLIDMLDVDSRILMYFSYHMHGKHIGHLKVQASGDPTFQSGVEDLMVDWGTFNSTIISGEQHEFATSGRTLAFVDSSSTYGSGFANWIGKRFYIRFLYTAGITHLGDCAIDTINIYKARVDSLVKQNSFKLLDPTYDNHHRPRAIYTRDTIAKRPVNIRNTGSSPLSIGNYFNRYEYLNTVSPEANDPWFIRNVDSISRAGNTSQYAAVNIRETLRSSSLRDDTLTWQEHQLPSREYLAGTTRNKTRIRTRFSAPGGFETLSRGFLDPAHETFSPNNAMTFRNLWPRNVHNTQMQAHQGQFGVSSHEQGTEANATITVKTGNNDFVGATEKQSLTLVASTRSGAVSKTYVIVDDNTTTVATGDILTAGSDTGGVTAGAALAGGIAVAINTTGTANTQYKFLEQLKAAIEHANGHNGKILVIISPGAAASGEASITLTHADLFQHQRSGNTTITSDIDASTGLVNLTIQGTESPCTVAFTGGQDSIARTYGSEVIGAIHLNEDASEIYTITGDASKHKYHRNNIERINFTGDSPRSTDPASSNVVFVTASSYDNAFISHMIPRTDNQTRWITGSLI